MQNKSFHIYSFFTLCKEQKLDGIVLQKRVKQNGIFYYSYHTFICVLILNEVRFLSYRACADSDASFQ